MAHVTGPGLDIFPFANKPHTPHQNFTITKIGIVSFRASQSLRRLMQEGKCKGQGHGEGNTYRRKRHPVEAASHSS